MLHDTRMAIAHVGMSLGIRLSRKLSGPLLQKGFAVVLVLVAVFMLTKSVV